MSEPLDLAKNLRTQSPERLWGVSTESVYSALAAKVTNNPLKKSLDPHIRAEIIRTNDERANNLVVSIHEWLLNEMGLVKNGKVSLLGMIVLTSDEPQPFVRAIAIARFESAEMVLRSCSEIEANIPRREFDSLLADDWDEFVLAPLLGSLGFVTTYSDSVDLDHDRISSSLSAQQTRETKSAIADSYREVLSHVIPSVDEACLEDLVKRLTTTGSAGAEIDVTAGVTLANTPSIRIDENEIEDAISNQRQEYEDELDIVRSLLLPSSEAVVKQLNVNEEIRFNTLSENTERSDDVWEAALGLVATSSAHPELSRFDVQFVTNKWPTVTPYLLYQTLLSIPGVDCEVNNGVIEFETVPKTVKHEPIRDKYTQHLVERCSTIQRRIDTLSQTVVSLPVSPVSTESVVVQDYESIDRGNIAPIYFTHSLVDPEALGEKKMDAYVGQSRALSRERAHLRRWHENRSLGLKSYTTMTDQLFGLGLERDLGEKILRIMTPFDDDTFNEYVAQIRRLLEQGFELRLLTRHTKEPWQWRRLQRNLLSEIKNHRDLVTVRTYSRFREYQRVSPDMDFREMGEFGIHGKLQTIGAPEEGAALLGSANFMENSYDWNPECGVYTEQTQFVESAVEFFDIVWDISAADEISIERLQEIPNRKLVPTYYS